MNAFVKVALPVSLLIALVYYLLGGFKPVQLEITSCSEFVMQGIYYRGTPQDKALGESFSKVEEVIARQEGAHLYTIYYSEPKGKLDTMEVFVGTSIRQNIGLGLERHVVPCDRAVTARISASRFVMPSPEKVKKLIENHAWDNDVVLSGVFIDHILASDEVMVWAPIAD